MATSRAERMQQRMRGAGRHQVQDIPFGPIFSLDDDEEVEEAESQAPAPRTTPNSSAKRRRLNGENVSGTASQLQTAAPVRSLPRRTMGADPYDIPDRSQEGTTSGQQSPLAKQANRAQNAIANLPRVTPRQIGRIAGDVVEEVGESPADAPGSGQRRTVRVSAAASQSALLQEAVAAVDDEEDPVQTSSPLTRKSGKGQGAVSTRSAARQSVRRGARLSNDADEVDELSPALVNVQTLVQSSSPAARVSRKTSSTKPVSSKQSGTRRSTRLSLDQNGAEDVASAAAAQSSSPLARRQQKEQKPASSQSIKPASRRSARLSGEHEDVDELSPEQPIRAGRNKNAPEPLSKKRTRNVALAEEAEEDGAAEEIDEQEAARRLGRKRPRVSLREPSPELGSQPLAEEPVAKRRRKQLKESPAKQKQPRPQKAKTKSPGQGRKTNEDDDTVPVQVQRFTKRIQYEEDDTDADILNAEIPYANRGGVNAIDVLSQMCEEIIDVSLAAFHERAQNAQDSATKREFRTKLRTLEAFQEELRTRLLEHTIALDTLHALKKRVRVIQKEKLSLREEILRIRGERDQVALRMDAVRIKHEAESKEALHQINLSSAMHDIDLAVERGQSAPDLTPAEQKVADLANLELLISRVSDQACSKSDIGGTLKQIKDFNAFLERAAGLLEGR